jgi:hypothetical protein
MRSTPDFPAMSKKKKLAPASAPAAPQPSAPSAPAASEPVDPRRQLIANITLAVFSVYVAMIYLLALDQQFHWGIFKP